MKAGGLANENIPSLILIAEQSMAVRLEQMPYPAQKTDVLGLVGSGASVNRGGVVATCVGCHAQYSKFSCLHHA